MSIFSCSKEHENYAFTSNETFSVSHQSSYEVVNEEYCEEITKPTLHFSSFSDNCVDEIEQKYTKYGMRSYLYKIINEEIPSERISKYGSPSIMQLLQKSW